MIRMPAIVVGDQSHGRIADLGFPGELCFLKISHADDRHSPGAIQLRFSLGRKRGPLHADVGSAAMNIDALEIRSGSLFQGIDQIAAYRIAEAYMSRDPITEKRRLTLPRAVKELVRKHDVHGLELCTK